MIDRGNYALFQVGIFYATLSVYTGVRQPYWGMWLVSQDLSQQSAGALATIYLAFESLAGIISGILLSNVRIRRSVVTACYLVLGTATALFFLAEGIATFLVLSIVAGFSFGCIYHAREVFWLEFCQANHHPYNTVRIWASTTFMVAAVVAGSVLARYSVDALLILILSAVAIGLVWFRLMVRPEAAALPQEASGTAQRPNQWVALTSLRQVRTLGPIYFAIVPIAGLIHSSQALFHLFSAVHFGALGIGNDWVGIYWAVALVSEIAVFVTGQRVINRFGPWALLIVSALLTIVRWASMAFVTDRFALLAIQLLHGFSSAGAPLAAGTLLIKTVPRTKLSIAQGLLQLTTNVCMGVMLMVSGIAYGIMGAEAFLLMAAAGVPALLVGLYMSRAASRQVAS